MKNKVITIAALLAVMVAMIGIAAADQINIVDKGTNNKVTSVALGLGKTVNLDINISEFTYGTGTLHDLNVRLTDYDTGDSVSGLKIYINEQDPSGSPKANGTWNVPSDNPIVTFNQKPTFGGSELFDLDITETKGTPARYLLYINDTVTLKSKVVELDAASIKVDVPEFPTVALPVAALIGLVFLFQQKKRKQE